MLETPWPAFDPTALVGDEVEIPVQINGKVRARLRLSTDAAVDRDALRAAALALPEVVERLANQAIQRVVVVPGRMVSIVVA